MLLQIRDFIQRAGVVSIQQLAREFRIDEQALQPMLDIWLGRGVIRQCQEKNNCKSSCFRCPSKAPVFYQFNLP
jgi:hypothetical protein